MSSEPAGRAVEALDALKRDIIELMNQRDLWASRYEEAMSQLAVAKAERDHWYEVAYEYKATQEYYG